MAKKAKDKDKDKDEDRLVDCHGRQLHAELDALAKSDPASRKAIVRSDKKPFYDSEDAADMFLRSMEFEHESERLNAIASGKETRAKEFLDSAAEDRAKALEFHHEAVRLKSTAAAIAPPKSQDRSSEVA